MYKAINLQHPLDGIARRTSFTSADLRTTPDAVNVWASDYSVNGGRDRIATRPGLASASVSMGAPYGWSDIAWTDSGAKRGVAIVHANGVRVLRASGTSLVDFDGTGNGTDFITTAPVSEFAGTCSFMGRLILARGAGAAYTNMLDSGTAGAGTLLSALTADTVPANCGVCVEHIDRLWLMGDTVNPRVLYACKTGDITDWDYADTANGSAIAITIRMPHNITGAISHTRDCLVIGMVDSVAVIRGNPGQISGGGAIETISHEVGPLNNNSWCHDSKGNLWIYTRDGLYVMPPGCGDALASVSREVLPGDVVATNPGVSGTYSALCYDARWRCLHLFIDKTGSANDEWWTYDLQRPGGAWWRHETSLGPLRLGVPVRGLSTSSESGLLSIDASGTGYQLTTGSSESFNANVLYGVDLAAPEADGYLHSLLATLGTESDSLELEVYVGGSAEEAYRNYETGSSVAAYVGADLVAGLNNWQHIRVRDAYAMLNFKSSGTERWAIESLVARLKLAGARRIH